MNVGENKLSGPRFPHLWIDLAFLPSSKNPSSLGIWEEGEFSLAGQGGKKSCGYSYMTFFFLVSSQGCLATCRKERVRVKHKRRTKLGVEKHVKGVNSRWDCQDGEEEGVTQPPDCNLKYLFYSIDTNVWCYDCGSICIVDEWVLPMGIRYSNVIGEDVIA